MTAGSRLVSPPRIVVAPDKFKGSLSAANVAAAIAEGLRDGFSEPLEIVIVPMADGGEGTVATFLESGADARTIDARGPFGEPVRATFALDGDTAILEMAAASGLVLAERPDALRATSYGTGELVLAALDTGARRIIVGIGGSATNDGGAGMLEALGARFLDGEGRPLAPGGEALARIARADFERLDPRLREIEIDVACDVDNPLLGPRGASAIFGPQKGATPADVRTLDAALERFADVVETATGRRVRDEPGSGAAGGLGFAFRAVLGATLRSGAELIADVRELAAALEGASLCVTGEGRIDEQTLAGKVVAGVARLARRDGVRVLALGGSIDPAIERELWTHGIVAFPVVPGPVTLREAMDDAHALIRTAAARAARLLQTPTVLAGAEFPRKRT